MKKGWHVFRFHHIVIKKKVKKFILPSNLLILIINILLCIYDYFINNNKLIKYEKYCNSV